MGATADPNHRPAAAASPIRWYTGFSIAAASAMAAMVLWLAGAPLGTSDLWFHLKAGETYWTQGLWPAGDPTLFTAHPWAPLQHEWLFGVFSHLGLELTGYGGLRLLNVLMALAIFALVWRLLRGFGAVQATAAAAGAVFLALCWHRLVQFRPHLWSIAATIGLYLLLLHGSKVPSRKRILAALGIVLVWTNAHSVVGVGIAIVGAGALGAALHGAILSRTLKAPPQQTKPAWRRVQALGLTFIAMLVLALVNPRGLDQLLTFFQTSGGSAGWQIHDEWHRFHPLFFGPPHNSAALSRLSWAVADAVMLGFMVAGFALYRVLSIRPSVEALERFDPTLFIVAAAAMGAMLISLRFLWLGIFPLGYALRAAAPLQHQHAARWALGSAVLSVGLLAALPGAGRFSDAAADVPHDVPTYVRSGRNTQRFPGEGAAFMKETRVEGRLFNPYEFGGYLGFELAPRVRVFVDGRTEHYPTEVFDDWLAVTYGRSSSNGRTGRQILDEWQVDFFYGYAGGAISGYNLPYTMEIVERDPDWMLVFRTATHSVHMRRAPRNEQNLRRIQRFYDRLGVPFDEGKGLRVANLLRSNLGWAIEQRLVPAEFDRLREQTQQGELSERAGASMKLANLLFVAGDYAGAARLAVTAIESPYQKKAVKLATLALLRGGHHDNATDLVDYVLRSFPNSPWLPDYRQAYGRFGSQ